MIAPILAALLAGSPAETGCAAHWNVELSQESFANNGAGRTFSPAELDAFRTKVENQLKAAVGDACRNGAIKAPSAKAIRRVRVSSASGASDPFIYPGVDGTLRFEWIFAEEELAVPSAKDIVAGAACWTDPNGPSCAREGD